MWGRVAVVLGGVERLDGDAFERVPGQVRQRFDRSSDCACAAQVSLVPMWFSSLWPLAFGAGAPICGHETGIDLSGR